MKVLELVFLILSLQACSCQPPWFRMPGRVPIMGPQRATPIRFQNTFSEVRVVPQTSLASRFNQGSRHFPTPMQSQWINRSPTNNGIQNNNGNIGARQGQQLFRTDSTSRNFNQVSTASRRIPSFRRQLTRRQQQRSPSFQRRSGITSRERRRNEEQRLNGQRRTSLRVTSPQRSDSVGSRSRVGVDRVVDNVRNRVDNSTPSSAGTANGRPLPRVVTRPREEPRPQFSPSIPSSFDAAEFDRIAMSSLGPAYDVNPSDNTRSGVQTRDESISTDFIPLSPDRIRRPRLSEVTVEESTPERVQSVLPLTELELSDRQIVNRARRILLGEIPRNAQSLINQIEQSRFSSRSRAESDLRQEPIRSSDTSERTSRRRSASNSQSRTSTLSSPDISAELLRWLDAFPTRNNQRNEQNTDSMTSQGIQGNNQRPAEVTIGRRETPSSLSRTRDVQWNTEQSVERTQTSATDTPFRNGASRSENRSMIDPWSDLRESVIGIGENSQMSSRADVTLTPTSRIRNTPSSSFTNPWEDISISPVTGSSDVAAGNIQSTRTNPNSDIANSTGWGTIINAMRDDQTGRSTILRSRINANVRSNTNGEVPASTLPQARPNTNRGGDRWDTIINAIRDDQSGRSTVFQSRDSANIRSNTNGVTPASALPQTRPNTNRGEDRGRWRTILNAVRDDRPGRSTIFQSRDNANIRSNTNGAAPTSTLTQTPPNTNRGGDSWDTIINAIRDDQSGRSTIVRSRDNANIPPNNIDTAPPSSLSQTRQNTNRDRVRDRQRTILNALRNDQTGNTAILQSRDNANIRSITNGAAPASTVSQTRPNFNRAGNRDRWRSILNAIPDDQTESRDNANIRLNTTGASPAFTSNQTRPNTNRSGGRQPGRSQIESNGARQATGWGSVMDVIRRSSLSISQGELDQVQTQLTSIPRNQTQLPSTNIQNNVSSSSAGSNNIQNNIFSNSQGLSPPGEDLSNTNSLLNLLGTGGPSLQPDYSLRNELSTLNIGNTAPFASSLLFSRGGSRPAGRSEETGNNSVRNVLPTLAETSAQESVSELRRNLTSMNSIESDSLLSILNESGGTAANSPAIAALNIQNVTHQQRQEPNSPVQTSEAVITNTIEQGQVAHAQPTNNEIRINLENVQNNNQSHRLIILQIGPSGQIANITDNTNHAQTFFGDTQLLNSNTTVQVSPTQSTTPTSQSTTTTQLPQPIVSTTTQTTTPLKSTTILATSTAPIVFPTTIIPKSTTSSLQVELLRKQLSKQGDILQRVLSSLQGNIKTKVNTQQEVVTDSTLTNTSNTNADKQDIGNALSTSDGRFAKLNAANAILKELGLSTVDLEALKTNSQANTIIQTETGSQNIDKTIVHSRTVNSRQNNDQSSIRAGTREQPVVNVQREGQPQTFVKSIPTFETLSLDQELIQSNDVFPPLESSAAPTQIPDNNNTGLSPQYEANLEPEIAALRAAFDAAMFDRLAMSPIRPAYEHANNKASWIATQTFSGNDATNEAIGLLSSNYSPSASLSNRNTGLEFPQSTNAVFDNIPSGSVTPTTQRSGVKWLSRLLDTPRNNSIPNVRTIGRHHTRRTVTNENSHRVQLSSFEMPNVIGKRLLNSSNVPIFTRAIQNKPTSTISNDHAAEPRKISPNAIKTAVKNILDSLGPSKGLELMKQIARTSRKSLESKLSHNEPQPIKPMVSTKAKQAIPNVKGREMKQFQMIDVNVGSRNVDPRPKVHERRGLKQHRGLKQQRGLTQKQIHQRQISATRKIPASKYEHEQNTGGLLKQFVEFGHQHVKNGNMQNTRSSKQHVKFSIKHQRIRDELRRNQLIRNGLQNQKLVTKQPIKSNTVFKPKVRSKSNRASSASSSKAKQPFATKTTSTPQKSLIRFIDRVRQTTMRPLARGQSQRKADNVVNSKTQSNGQTSKQPTKSKSKIDMLHYELRRLRSMINSLEKGK